MLERAATAPYCYLTTTGRRSGRDHEIEIWFATDGASLYLISGGGDRSDWVRNLRADPRAKVRLGDHALAVHGEAPMEPGDDRSRAVDLLHCKYRSQVSGTLESWQAEAFIVGLSPTGPAERATA